MPHQSPIADELVVVIQIQVELPLDIVVYIHPIRFYNATDKLISITIQLKVFLPLVKP